MNYLKCLFLILVVSCGAPVEESYGPTPPAAPAPPPPSGGPDNEALTFAGDVKPLLTTFCAQCHSTATFLSSEVNFLASSAPTRIANKSMPQRQSKNYALWTDAERAVIAEFVAQSSL